MSSDPSNTTESSTSSSTPSTRSNRPADGICHVDEEDDEDISPSTPPSPRSRPADANQEVPSSSNGQDTSSTAPLGISWSKNFLQSNNAPEETNGASNSNKLDRSGTATSTANTRHFWKFHMRGYDDEDDVDWWFASTAVPLLAATIAPLANVLSIAALVTSWRMSLKDPANPGQLLPEFSGITYKDPRWCISLNVVSLICGFVGNIFLLFNFTGRIRYILALPATIVLWFVATGVLFGITYAMHVYVPPEFPIETYSQGFWYAVIAAVLYFICSALLMFNMLGYFLGHYPQRFELNDHQRTLILQTMLFFIWLAGGAAIFSKIESMDNDQADWGFVNGLYFCDVTILTVGFGDLVLHNDLGRGLVFPYTVGGIVMLGLVISSISKFAAEISETNVVQKHVEKVRHRTLERSTTDPLEVERHEILRKFKGAHIGNISSPFNGHRMNNTQRESRGSRSIGRNSLPSSQRRASVIPQVHKRINVHEVVKSRHRKVRLLREERDRFDEMRRIQRSTQSFKRWWALSLSVLAFATLWCLGAVVLWQTEKEIQGMTYFQALYFCYVSLLTIGYGDFAPRSNAGRPFFVVWSLIAVPTMTLLISDMSSTVIDSFKKTTFFFADFTLLLRKGVWADFLKSHPRITAYLRRIRDSRARRKRLREGIPFPEPSQLEKTPNAAETHEDEERHLAHFATELRHDEHKPPSEAKMARRLALAIRAVASDLKSEGERTYSFEEWAELTRLIRFTSEEPRQAQADENADVIEWDWLGEHSPMMSGVTEAEFVLDRLVESLVRYMGKVEKIVKQSKRTSKSLEFGRTNLEDENERPDVSKERQEDDGEIGRASK
ncbi:voltage-gated potassium channel [Microthyrium microscopicum]|uniref:Voltage-gated potassium channel n=1 Tax=Microthyrium microscopicum TaxID=703497 RepID=A0A6A6U7K1_9PEZI|nr:voltage-gated potassium channel [Microthyrium microscopicum]